MISAAEKARLKRNAAVQRYRKRHPERVRELQRRWRRNNPDRWKAMRARINKRYQDRHTEAIRKRSRDQMRVRYWANPELSRERAKAWFERNRERLLADPNFRKRRRERSNAWYLRNKQKHLEASRKWKRRNPERVRASNLRCKTKAIERYRKWKALNRDRVKMAKRIYVEKATPGYLSQITGIPLKFLPPAFIAAKREHLKLKRLLKELNLCHNQKT